MIFFRFCNAKRVSVITPKRTSPVEMQKKYEDLWNSDNALALSPLLPQVKGGQNEPRPRVASASQEELKLKQQVAKRLGREVALILEEELELEQIKREAEEKVQNLNERIRTRQSKVGILSELLEN